MTEIPSKRFGLELGQPLPLMQIMPNIIFETYKSNIEMIYTPKYQVIYFLYFVFGTWMCVGASTELVILEEEYPAWVAFSHLQTPIP